MFHEEVETMLIAGLEQEEMAISNDEHHKLSLHLIDLLAKELFELQGSKQLYGEEEILTWLVGAVSPVFNNIDVAMEQMVNSHRIYLKDLEFRAWDEADQPLWLDVLGKLKNIYFENCEFHCTKLALNHAATWYEGCKFSQPWFVTMGKNPEGLVERGDSLYNACEFSKGVSLYGDDVDEETLGLYGIVFQDCKMTSLYVNAMNLAARLYVAPVEPVHVFKPNRHGTPMTLENFQVFSTVFKKAFDLSRLHFGEIQFSGCTFEEGVDLSGLVCDRLGLDSGCGG